MSQIDVKKYESVILYLAKQLGGEVRGRKKLAKLLYFVDFDFFEKNEVSVTGDTYKRLKMGPVPEHMLEIVQQLEKEKRVSIESIPEHDGYIPTEVYRVTTQDIGDNLLSVDEKMMLDRVVKKYGFMNGKQLEVLTHAEAPYLGTNNDEVIPYELSFYRGTDFSEHA